MSYRSVALVLAVAAFSAVSLSCPLNPPPDDGPLTYTEEVGPAGGTIDDGDGTRLIIPPGALNTQVEISVTTYNDTVALGAQHPDLVGALCGVELRPDGLQFATPVVLEMSPGRVFADGPYPVFFHDTSGDVWVQTGTADVSADGLTLETEISHFSSLSVFDLPYGVMDDFLGFASEHMTDYPEDPPGDLGELYVEGYMFEEESFCGQDQYYNGCCYMRAGAKATINYTYEGTPYNYTGDYGYTTDKSFDLSYSGSASGISYSIDLTVYLDCSLSDAVFFVDAYDSTLSPWESTDITAHFICSDEPIPNREINFSLSGPGELSSTRATTNPEGVATVTYSADDEGTAVVTGWIEGCDCVDWPTANRDEVTITISDDDGIENWSGVLTLHQWGDLLAFDRESDEHTTIVSDTICTVDLNIIVHFTCNVTRSYGLLFMSIQSAIGSFSASVTPGYVEWIAHHPEVYYVYQNTYTINHFDQESDIVFPEFGFYAYPDEIHFDYDDILTEDVTELFMEYSLDCHSEGIYHEGSETSNLPGFPRDETDIERNRANGVEITIDPPLENGFTEGTIMGTEGRCIWYERSINGTMLSVSWSLTMERLDDD
jgi:hypothetical protein